MATVRLYIALAIFIVACFSPGRSLAQTSDSTIHAELKEALPFSRTDSAISATAIGLQFLAGEVAFNATSFSLWGNQLYKGSSQGWGGGIGIAASIITIPLAIHFTTELLNLKTGSWGWSTVGAFAGFWVGPFLLLPQKTYITRYLAVSLPLIAISELIYDLTMQ